MAYLTKHSALMLSFLSFTIVPASAASVSWDGGGGNDQWSKSSNWSPNIVPTLNDDVTITNASVAVEQTTLSGAKTLLLDNSNLTVNPFNTGSAIGTFYGLPQSTLTNGSSVEVIALNTYISPIIDINGGSTFTVKGSATLDYGVEQDPPFAEPWIDVSGSGSELALLANSTVDGPLDPSGDPIHEIHLSSGGKLVFTDSSVELGISSIRVNSGGILQSNSFGISDASAFAPESLIVDGGNWTDTGFASMTSDGVAKLELKNLAQVTHNEFLLLGENDSTNDDHYALAEVENGAIWNAELLFVGAPIGVFPGQHLGLLSVDTASQVLVDELVLNEESIMAVANGSTVSATNVVINGPITSATPFTGIDNRLALSNGVLRIDGGQFVVSDGDFALETQLGGDANLQLVGGATSNIGNLVLDSSTPGDTAYLNILGGSVMTSADSKVGDGSGSMGAVNVDGVGSIWTTSGNLTVGNGGGNGTLEVTSGAVVMTNAIGYIGRNSGSTGVSEVNGAGSKWTISSTFIAGFSGDGTFNVTNGGVASNHRGVIGFNSGSKGDVDVDGAGSTWTNTESLYVGGDTNAAGGNATLDVTNEGAVDVVGTLQIWNTGTVTLDGGSITTTTLNHTDGGAFNFDDGTLAVGTFQGTLTQDGGTLAPGASPGTTTITGAYNLNGGTLETEFGGAGNPIDLVDVTGNINIALVGTSLDLLPLGGMAAGTYALMHTTAGTLTGLFENVTDLGVYDDLFGVQYTATTVTLTLDFDLLAGDFDLDGDVDGSDYLKWQRGESPNPLSAADLADWEANYGTVALLTANSNAVPEPATWIMLLIGVATMLISWRKVVPKLNSA